jgi:hypothetical protein
VAYSSHSGQEYIGSGAGSRLSKQPLLLISAFKDTVSNMYLPGDQSNSHNILNLRHMNVRHSFLVTLIGLQPVGTKVSAFCVAVCIVLSHRVRFFVTDRIVPRVQPRDPGDPPLLYINPSCNIALDESLPIAYCHQAGTSWPHSRS